MLMGAGLLSKFVELVAAKLIGKHLDLALDEKRRACYTFVELYFILQGFASLTKGFAKEIEDAPYGPITTINLMVKNGRSIQALTTRFFDLHEDLYLTLDVVDHTLAEVFDRVHTFKGSIFYAIADSITIAEEEPRHQSILYRRPSEQLLAIDLDAYYQTLQSFEGDKWDAPWIWPSELTELPDYEAAFPSVQFKTDDKEKLGAFTRDLRRQADLLDTAIEKLRALIHENFTLDEILSSSRRLPES
jgi:hypothetical protein